MVLQYLVVASVLLVTPTLGEQSGDGLSPYYATPYCGLHCIYAAARLLGRSPAFESIVSAEYCDQRGSSLMQLKRAAEALGLCAQPLRSLNASFLRRTDHILVLHVKKDFDSRSANHYILLLDAPDDETAVIYDPPAPPKSVTMGSLLARWDGTGLAVSGAPISHLSILAST